MVYGYTKTWSKLVITQVFMDMYTIFIDNTNINVEKIKLFVV